MVTRGTMGDPNDYGASLLIFEHIFKKQLASHLL
jgi:hypothetical protein